MTATAKAVSSLEYGLKLAKDSKAPFHREYVEALSALLEARSIHATDAGNAERKTKVDQALAALELKAVHELVSGELKGNPHAFAVMLTRVVARAARLTLRDNYVRFDTWFSVEAYAHLRGDSEHVRVRLKPEDSVLLPDHIPDLKKLLAESGGKVGPDGLQASFGWDFYTGGDRKPIRFPLHAWLLPIAGKAE